jgi:hypothetical protein
MQVNVKSTRINPSASHPHKAHKKLRIGTAKVGRTTIEAPWLRADGWMTKRPGKPPYKFLHRKNVTFPSQGKHGKSGKAHKPSKKGVMSQAAKKAWKTRRARHH